jgi:hypothetical protein
MLETIAAIVLTIAVLVLSIILLAAIMAFLGIVKGVDLEHLHDDDLE